MSNNRKKKEQMSVDVLREVIHYDPETGKFFWKERSSKYFDTDARCAYWNQRFANKEAMTSSREGGYKQGSIFNANYKAHQVAWFYCYGYWPEGLDHINGVPSDNRLENLREAGQDKTTRINV